MDLDNKDKEEDEASTTRLLPLGFAVMSWIPHASNDDEADGFGEITRTSDLTSIILKHYFI